MNQLDLLKLLMIIDINMSAINHWERAIETHSQNYPFAEHRCENVQHIEPNTLAASKDCDLMWASPGCQHFSIARGKKPRSEDKRSPAWEVLHFTDGIMLRAPTKDGSIAYICASQLGEEQ